jgi:hypothetical protein
MDMRRHAFHARIKITGVKDFIPVNNGEPLSLALLVAAIGRALQGAPNRYGDINIELSQDRFSDEPVDQEAREFKGLHDWMAGLAEMETPEEEAFRLSRESNSPYHVGGPNYDELAHEYILCLNRAHKQRKSPEELMILRKHMEERYSGTEWWDGTHKWMDTSD